MSKLDNMIESTKVENQVSLPVQKGFKRKIPAIIIITISSIAVIVLALLFILPKFTNQNVIPVPTPKISENVDIEDLYNKTKLPIDMLSWTNVPYFMAVESNENLAEQASTWANEYWLNMSTNVLPSTKEGYVNDVEKATLENGLPNLKYSYVLKDDVEYAFAIYTQRLLNPLFGNWGIYQYPGSNPSTNISTATFKDMFTTEWWESNVKPDDTSKIPIYADWKNNDYNSLNFDKNTNYRFFGEIVSSNNITTTSSSEGVTLIADLNVKYYALAEDGTKIVKDGVLKITLSPNMENTDDVEHRMLISDVHLTIQ